MTFHESATSKIVTPEEASRKIEGLRLKGRKIVFTNGCFDILHKGHVECLSKARDLGQYLVVGLNSDSSVKKLNKAENRPINDESSRAAVLSGLSAVDAVVIFDEETPLELMKRLRPDVIVKGGDYKKEEIVGYKEVKSWGGDVIIIPLIDGFSTTKIIEKIK